MLYSNYNVLVLPVTADGVYKIGDVYQSKYFKDGKFHGLTIRNIDYCFGVRLHFHWAEWYYNIPPVEEKIITPNKTINKGFI